MIIDFLIGIFLLGTLFHLTLGLWRVKVLSPFGSTPRANIAYGTFVFLAAIGLYLYRHGFSQLLNDFMILGAVFAIIYTILFGLWVNRGK